MGRLLLRLLFGPVASVPVPARVQRTGRVLAQGCDVARMVEPAGPTKLSAEDATRCFGVNQGGRLWTV